MGILVLLILGVITALLAGRKGYEPVLWFLPAGVIGLIILACLPFVNEKSKLPKENRQSQKKTGNIIGGVLSVVTIVVIVLNLALIVAIKK